MELLALVIFNIVFGVILYFTISIKVTNSVRDYQITKMKKEIQNLTLNFYKESESYLSFMDSRINILKNLIQKAESMGIDFQKLESLETDRFTKKFEEKKQERDEITQLVEILKKEPTPPITSKQKSSPQESLKSSNKVKNSDTKQNPLSKPTEPSDDGVLPFLGKVFRGIMGVPDPITSREILLTERPPQNAPPKKNHKYDISIGGNPFEDTQTIQNQTQIPRRQFSEFLDSDEKNEPPEDKITISVEAALRDLPESAPKVDKVVYLLKKGFSHTQISEELGLAIPEISLIETIKIEKNRRI